ncbi:MAG: tripartite tricarboxylate transporter substrate binding protein [Rhizobacter sp.]|nr:tripartite tricarboxylate transporter substrate binding protein [Rhizobacter sp.]
MHHSFRPRGRTLAALTACVLAAGALPGQALAQPDAYPAHVVTLVVPTASGGGTDTIARVFAEALQRELKQTFIVENKPGANGMLGAADVAKASPDGYRLLFSYTAAMAVNPWLYRKVPYDTRKDFVPVAQIGRGGNLMLVRTTLPVKTPQELAAYAKAHPGELNYCSWGIGSGGHLAMESFKKQAGVKMTHIPYKGSAPCALDVVAGTADAAFADTSSTIELVRSGRVRAIATSGPARLPQLPDVPTMNEAGYPFTTYSWYGVFAPAGTPAPIIEKLNATLNKLFKDPAILKKMRDLNFNELPANTPAQFAAQLDKDLQDWGALVKQIGVVLD